MKTIRSACTLQPNALEINVGDQIEKLDEIINNSDGKEYFNKTFITEGMKTMLTRGMARLAGTIRFFISNRRWAVVKLT